MAEDHGAQIKDDEKYEALLDEGMSKEKAARIANASAKAKNTDARSPEKKGGKAPPYEEWSKEELYKRAQELDVEGRSGMDKQEIIDALRSR